MPSPHMQSLLLNGQAGPIGETDGFDRKVEEQLEAPILKLKAAMTALGAL
jgi:hypothetical protein